MPRIARYRPRPLLRRMAPLMGMSMAQILTAAGLPKQSAEEPNPSVTAAQFFKLWDTIHGLIPEGLGIDHAREAARGPFTAQSFAFSCSENVTRGLARLASLRPLSAPVSLRVTAQDGLKVEFTSQAPERALPASFALAEVVQIIELIRQGTEHHVRPVAITVPDSSSASVLADFAGCEVSEGPLTVVLSEADGRRPLLARGGEHWAAFEPRLLRHIAAEQPGASAADQLRAALFEVLPSGQSDAGAAAARLGRSKRSLQRHLQEEGTSFGAILEEMRRELAIHYLTREDLRVEEIAFLLAFRDPNSFYRAFQGWTGMAPRAARTAYRQVGTGVAPTVPAPIAPIRPPQSSTKLS